MTRCLVVCIDGTWNSSAEKSKLYSFPTNVERISKLLVNDGKEQRVVYRPGVGTQGFVDRVIGGVWGAGSQKRIRDGYRFLCENYEAGDRLAFFGFSRGAFAVRSLMGMVGRVGVLRTDKLDHVRQAVYLAQSPLRRDRGLIESFAQTHCHDHRPHVMFVGVWDTVIRYGPILTPFREILGLALRRYFGFFDHRVPPWVASFCHALALDERRSAFWPWRVSTEKYDPRQTVEEIWFAGSHSDVGGGYRDSRPADFPLQWIAEQAAKAGLLFRQMPLVAKDAHLVPLNPSRVGIWRVLPSRRRIVQDSDRIHSSVELRASQVRIRSGSDHGNVLM